MVDYRNLPVTDLTDDELEALSTPGCIVRDSIEPKEQLDCYGFGYDGEDEWPEANPGCGHRSEPQDPPRHYLRPQPNPYREPAPAPILWRPDLPETPSQSPAQSAEPPQPNKAIAHPRDYQRALSFDFSIIAAAQFHYGILGYRDVPVPWVVSAEAMGATIPEWAVPYSTFGGHLVGSAEQSFVELLLQGQPLGKVQATTPCFRDEDHDELHSPYFLKTELFNSVLPPTEASVLSVLEDARQFFARYVPVKLQQEGELAWDLVHAESGIELGSYGVRTIPGHSWIYGTGVALPRLQQTMGR